MYINNHGYRIGTNQSAHQMRCEESSSSINAAMSAEKIRLEVDVKLIVSLLENKQLCASDFRCLDFPSKQRVREICLKTCLCCIKKGQESDDAM